MGDGVYKKEHLAKGLCVFCSAEAIPGHRYCYKHLLSRSDTVKKYCAQNKEKLRKKSLKDKRRLIKECRCRECGAPLHHEVDSPVTCYNCSNRLRRKRGFNEHIHREASKKLQHLSVR